MRAQKKKTRRLSIEKKVLWSVVLLGLISCCFMGITVYSMVSDDMLNSSRENTRCIAASAAKIIDGDLHDELKPGDEDSEVYQSYLASLRACKNETGVLYMYTLKPLNADYVQFVVDTDESDMQGQIGEEYEISDMMIEALAGKTVASEEPTDDEFGQYFSAFAPVYNKAGAVVAIVGVDLELSVVENSLATLRNVILLIAGISFIVSVLIGLILSKNIGKNLGIVNSKIDDVVHSDGDLTKMIRVTSGDELELMADSLNEFLAHLRAIVKEIVNAAATIYASQGNIGTQMADAVGGITTAAATMEEMTAGMEMTTAAANLIHSSVNEVGTMVEKIYQDSTQGAGRAEEISKTAIAMKEDAVKAQEHAKTLLKEITEELEAKIAQSKAVENISGLSGEIINIAKRTNTLALNASIESARAGEAGRSFAIVASQVAELSASSSRTAEEIGKVSKAAIEAVYGLNDTVAKVMNFMEQDIMRDYEKLADTGEEYNKDANEFYRILSGFKENASSLEKTMEDIQKELGIVVETIDSNTHCISDATVVITEINDNMTNIEEASKANGEVVETLKQVVGHFKI